jgi:hypothetical protein
VKCSNQCHVTTRSQHSFSKPKTYTDGTIGYGQVASSGEPTTVYEAPKDLNWKNAMNVEFEALQSNKTWHLVPPRRDVNVIDYKWVYKIKRKSDGRLIGIRPDRSLWASNKDMALIIWTLFVF